MSCAARACACALCVVWSDAFAAGGVGGFLFGSPKVCRGAYAKLSRSPAGRKLLMHTYLLKRCRRRVRARVLVCDVHTHTHYSGTLPSQED